MAEFAAFGSVAGMAEAVESVAEIGAAAAVHLKAVADFAVVVVAVPVELHTPGVEQEPGKSEAPSEVSCCSHQSVDCSILAAGEQAERKAE